MNESRIQGSLCYTGADFEAVIALMAKGTYDTTGWVAKIPIDDVIDEGLRGAACRQEDESSRRPHRLKETA